MKIVSIAIPQEELSTELKNAINARQVSNVPCLFTSFIVQNTREFVVVHTSACPIMQTSQHFFSFEL